MRTKLLSLLLIGSIVTVVFFTSCEKETTTNETGTFTDSRDGNTYKTVTIGDQTWMAENLAYNAGTGTHGEGYADRWGYLYIWETAITAVPDGWHIPTKAEWNELIMELGGADVAADKLTDIDSGDWTNQESTDDTNSSGFSALPAGRYGYGTSGYDNRNQAGFWWTIDEFNDDMAYHYYIISNLVLEDKEYKTKGLSLRCIKD